MRKKYVFTKTSEGGKTLYTTVLTSGSKDPAKAKRKLIVTIQMEENGYIRLKKGVQKIGGASWEYDGSIAEDLERFENDNPCLLGKLAKAIREDM